MTEGESPTEPAGRETGEAGHASDFNNGGLSGGAAAQGPYAAASIEMTQSCEERNQQGMQLYLNGHIDDAIRCWESSAEEAPEIGETHYFLGRARLEKGECDTAKTSVERAIEVEGKKVEFLHLLGRIYDHLGDFEGAVKQWKFVIRKAPDYPSPYISLGIAYKKKGKLRHAIELLKRGLDLNPCDVEGNRELGDLFYILKDLKSALRFWRRALRKDPGNPGLKKNIGLAFYKMKRYGLCASYLRDVADSEIRDATIFRNLARAYYSLGNYTATIECFEKSLEFDWESTSAHMARLECMRLRDLLGKKKERKETRN